MISFTSQARERNRMLKQLIVSSLLLEASYQPSRSSRRPRDGRWLIGHSSLHQEHRARSAAGFIILRPWILVPIL